MPETPSGYFPSFVKVMKGSYQPPIRIEADEEVNPVSGVEQRRYRFGPVRDFTFRTGFLNQVQDRTLQKFYEDHRGIVQPFYFFSPEEEYFDKTIVGVTDGSGNLTMRVTETSLITAVHHGDDDVALASWTIAPNFGTGGEDRITGMVVAPLTGRNLKLTGYGRLRHVVRFTAMSLPKTFAGAGRRPAHIYDISLKGFGVIA